jgi:hypothetical protein
VSGFATARSVTPGRRSRPRADRRLGRDADRSRLPTASDVRHVPTRSRVGPRRCTPRRSGPGPRRDEGGSSCRRSGRRRAGGGSTLRAAKPPERTLKAVYRPSYPGMSPVRSIPHSIQRYWISPDEGARPADCTAPRNPSQVSRFQPSTQFGPSVHRAGSAVDGGVGGGTAVVVVGCAVVDVVVGGALVVVLVAAVVDVVVTEAIVVVLDDSRAAVSATAR